jgi:WD40 repeat protein
LKEYIPVSNPQTISTNENDQQFENDTRNIQLEVGATVIELGTVNETVTNQGILVAETMEEITDGLFDVPSDHSDNSLDLHDLLSELPPTILSMNGHFIITNNPARTGIMLWDTKTGTLIDTLTETSIVSNVIDQNIRIGEVSRDGTMIFATTDSTQVDGRLLLWDYSSKSRDIGCRVVHLQNAVEQHPLSIFFCAPTRQV